LTAVLVFLKESNAGLRLQAGSSEPITTDPPNRDTDENLNEYIVKRIAFLLYRVIVEN